MNSPPASPPSDASTTSTASKKRKQESLENCLEELRSERSRLRDKNRTNSQRFRDRTKAHMDSLFEQKYNLGKKNLELKSENERLKRLLQEAKEQKARNLILQEQLLLNHTRRQEALLAAAQERAAMTRDLVGASPIFYPGAILPLPHSSVSLLGGGVAPFGGGLISGGGLPYPHYSSESLLGSGAMVPPSAPIAKLLATRKHDRMFPTELSHSADSNINNSIASSGNARIAMMGGAATATHSPSPSSCQSSAFSR